jgi:predicted RNA binding protein YcfA (HicA-like mRNA interferase family)
MRNIRSKEVVKILERNGFEVKRQNGTHVILENNKK